MNEIAIFQSEEFGSVKTTELDGKIYFCASDVTKSLGYSNGRDAVSKHCRYVVKCDAPHPQSKNKIIQMSFIPEGDLYRLIAHSKLQSAEKFESWIFDEVLPTIRKTGGYVANDEMFIQNYLPFADDNTKALFKATLGVISQQNKIIEQQKPAVEFVEQISVSDDCISMNDMAKLVNKNSISIGRNRLFAFLRTKKILNDHNIPYQRYLNEPSWFQLKETTYYAGDKAHIGLTTTVTTYGQRKIVEMLKSDTKVTK